MKKLLTKLGTQFGSTEFGSSARVPSPLKASSATASPTKLSSAEKLFQFGSSLEKLVQKVSVQGSDEDPLIKPPVILINLIEFLSQEECLKTEGIFRLSASQKVLDKLKSDLDADPDCDLFQYSHDVIAVAAALKLWLRQLRNGLITSKYTSPFLNLPETDATPQLKRAIDNLPDESYWCLRYLICFLRKVSKWKDINKMGISNLAMVFGPNLVAHEEEKKSGVVSGLSSLVGGGKHESSTVTKLISVMNLMLEYYEELFLKDEDPTEWELRLDTIDQTLKADMVKKTQLKLQQSESKKQQEMEEKKDNEKATVAPNPDVAPSTAHQTMIDELKTKLEAIPASPELSTLSRGSSTPELAKKSDELMDRMQKKAQTVKAISTELLHKTGFETDAAVTEPQSRRTTSLTEVVVDSSDKLVTPHNSIMEPDLSSGQKNISTDQSSDRPPNSAAMSSSPIHSLITDGYSVDSPRSIMKKRSISGPSTVLSPKSVRFDPELIQIKTIAVDDPSEKSQGESSMQSSESENDDEGIDSEGFTEQFDSFTGSKRLTSSIDALYNDKGHEKAPETNQLDHSSSEDSTIIHASADNLVSGKKPQVKPNGYFDAEEYEDEKEIIIEVENAPLRVPAASPTRAQLHQPVKSPQKMTPAQPPKNSENQLMTNVEPNLKNLTTKIEKINNIQEMLKRPVSPADAPTRRRKESFSYSNEPPTIKLDNNVSNENALDDLVMEAAASTAVAIAQKIRSSPALPKRPPKLLKRKSNTDNDSKENLVETAIFSFVPDSFIGTIWDDQIPVQSLSLEERTRLRQLLRTTHDGLKEFQQYLVYIKSFVEKDDVDYEVKNAYVKSEISRYRDVVSKFKRLRAYLKTSGRRRSQTVPHTEYFLDDKNMRDHDDGGYSISPISAKTQGPDVQLGDSSLVFMTTEDLLREKHVIKKEIERIKSETNRDQNSHLMSALKFYHAQYREIKQILAERKIHDEQDDEQELNKLISPLTPDSFLKDNDNKVLEAEVELLQALKQEKSKLESLLHKYEWKLEQESLHRQVLIE